MLIKMTANGYEEFASCALMYHKSKKTAYHALISELESKNKLDELKAVVSFFNEKMNFLFFKVKNKVNKQEPLLRSDFDIDEFKKEYITKELDKVSVFRDNAELKDKMIYAVLCAKSAFKTLSIV